MKFLEIISIVWPFIAFWLMMFLPFFLVGWKSSSK